MARVYQNQRVFLTPVVGPLERLDLPLPRGRRRAAGPGLEGLRQDGDRLQRPLLRLPLPDPAHAEHPAVQPGGLRRRPLGPHLQHHLLLRHQHQLAVLRRRDDALLLQPDVRPRGAELHLRRGRDGRAGRGDPRLRLARRRGAGQLLAGPDPLGPLHPAADLVRRRAGPRLPGRDPDLSRLLRLRDARRLRTGPVARAGRLADRDQAARHQRRRLLQRQLVLPVREPDRLRQLRRDALHPADPGRGDRRRSAAWSATAARAGPCTRR